MDEEEVDKKIRQIPLPNLTQASEEEGADIIRILSPGNTFI
jgi:hypothetical protein